MLVAVSYVQRRIGLAYVGSIAVAVLMTIASLAALVDWSRIYARSGVRGGDLT